ncbi:hypothetical protein O7632_10275 [Solwaraspora sp. WMMD406]|nr:hypothetical protein [Solwaraspora sp. WMMD406]MDG4764487.1 hypothetical protein [Solwaraspora sp. WMMD406]
MGVIRAYRTWFIPENGYTVYLPAPFNAVHTYLYGPDGRLRPATGTR